MMRCTRQVVSAVVLTFFLVSAAFATNGYFTHGYGTAAKGLAGAGVALPQDALAAATNPAGMAFVGQRYDAGLALFNPNRHYTVEGLPSLALGTFGLAPGTVDSGSTLFPVPYFGANWEVGGSSTFGVSVYGHGGMNTDYPTATFFAAAPTGVDLSQLFLVPTYAVKWGGGRHAFGVSPVLVFQRFEVRGVQTFAAFSADPSRLSNNGHDESTGFGVKLGYLGQWTPRFSFGVAYQSEMAMEEFDSYAGLFAEGGGFDIPASVWLGFAYQASDRLTVALDVQEIDYSSIRSVGNPLFPNLFQAPLGAANGPGFGWDDMTVVKLGFMWKGRGPWTWRFGVSTGDQPIPESEMLFNILAPGVMEEHLTVGFSRELPGNRALNVAVMRAFSSSVRGPNPLELPGVQQIELEMDQWDLEVSFSWGY